MHISKDQLHHLAHLAKLELTADQEDKYLKDLENIIGFLDTLELDAQSTTLVSDASLHTFTGTEKYPDPKSLLQNSKHPIEQNCISIQTSLKNS
ncbi:MAG: Asp-tRNA(Asn)/Glu-tRNA(Gln) amidotransferase subunit GatC [bacterium]|nr:Asp-tRNA(Asn)/Glu-tRNA(Gln) amidotransferase subunit GatC [bacterium]